MLLRDCLRSLSSKQKSHRRFSFGLIAFLLSAAILFLLPACKREGSTDAPDSKSGSGVAMSKDITQNTSAELLSRGKMIYMTRCIACHNADPKKPGAIGPDIYGSPRALIEARVLRAGYPVGYTPKRPTKLMVALPDLSHDIEALAAFLNQ
jgi:mono/diheme cytochrome c family protein